MKTVLVRIGSKEKKYKKRAVAGTDEQSMRCNDVFSVEILRLHFTVSC